MEFIFFLVKSSSWYNANNWEMAHSLWYVDNSGFLFGLLISLGIALLSALIFYGLIGRFTHILSSIIPWSVYGILTAVIAFVVTLFQARDGLVMLAENGGYFEEAPEFRETLLSFTQDMWMFALHICLYTSLFFWGFSLLFRPISIHCKMTPCGKSNKINKKQF